MPGPHLGQNLFFLSAFSPVMLYNELNDLPFFFVPFAGPFAAGFLAPLSAAMICHLMLLLFLLLLPFSFVDGMLLFLFLHGVLQNYKCMPELWHCADRTRC